MSSRRVFLAATSAIVGLTGTSADSALAAAGPYDFSTLDARLQRSARHRQVFAVARVADGVAFGLMSHALDAYEKTLNEPAGSLHPAAVFYGRGVVLGLNDRMWRKYRLADHVHRRGDVLTATGTASNPFDAQMSALDARGATFLVCDNALADWSEYLVTVAGFGASGPAEIRAEFRDNLAPSALLVPAGVMALNAAQEAHFTFVQASL